VSTFLGSELSDDEAALLQALPPSGKSRGNQAVRDELGWPPDRYFAARNALEERGLALRGAGRGGSIHRRIDVEVDEVVTVPIKRGSTPDGESIFKAAEDILEKESDLYPALQEVIRRDWAQDRGVELLGVEVVARQGSRPTGGIWSRPDIVAVSVRNLMYFPTKILEVTTFEVKGAAAINVQAVYEALAQRRGATHSFVLLHVPRSRLGALAETVEQIRETARQHRVGVVTFADPSNYDTWESLESAARVEPDPVMIDRFIAQQLPEGLKNKIWQRLH
jgi:hypothetical protein